MKGAEKQRGRNARCRSSSSARAEDLQSEPSGERVRLSFVALMELEYLLIRRILVRRKPFPPGLDVRPRPEERGARHHFAPVSAE